MFSHSYTTFSSSSIYTTPDAPGRAIEASFGMVGVYSQNTAITKDGVKTILDEAFEELLKQSIALGGNAVVAVHFQSWVAAVILTGTAVRLNNPTT